MGKWWSLRDGQYKQSNITIQYNNSSNYCNNTIVIIAVTVAHIAISRAVTAVIVTGEVVRVYVIVAIIIATITVMTPL